MKTNQLILIALLTGVCRLAEAASIGTAFTYQGLLTGGGGTAATGLYDLQLSLYDDESFGSQVSPVLTRLAVPVTNGLFTVNLDFGASVFNGEARWLEMAVRTNNSPNPFATLTPRQPLTPAPYALYAANAALLGGQAAGAFAPASGSSAYVAKAGDSMTGPLHLPADGLVAGASQLALSGGYVGVGTINPDRPLTVQAAGPAGLDWLAFKTSDGLTRWHLSSLGGGLDFAQTMVADYRLFLGTNGNVGVGTGTPSQRLDVNGTVRATAFQGEGSGLTFSGAITAMGLNLYGDSDLNDHTIFLRPGTSHGLGWYGSGKPFAAVSTIDGPVLFGWNGGALGSTGTGEKLALYWDPYGNVDLYGDLSVNGNVDLASDLRLTDHDLRLRGSSDVNHGLGWYGGAGRSFAGTQVDGPVLYGWDGGALGSTGGGERLTLYWNMWGMVGIGTNVPQTTLHVVGTTRTSVLEITGGSDLAEPFEMSTPQVPKGAVVIIDDENAGRLKLSDRAYDTRVAGIISGANGINAGLTLSQAELGNGGQNVALSGRVYALAEASNGAIRPGDLLTTSDVPGHAMKVTDPAKAQGAILGKAMSGLKEGKGLVLVLVSLQ